MFRHRGAILRESSRTNEYKHNTLVYVLHCPTGMLNILKYKSVHKHKNYNITVLKLYIYIYGTAHYYMILISQYCNCYAGKRFIYFRILIFSMFQQAV
jgi:hypothetical protein